MSSLVPCLKKSFLNELSKVSSSYIMPEMSWSSRACGMKWGGTGDCCFSSGVLSKAKNRFPLWFLVVPVLSEIRLGSCIMACYNLPFLRLANFSANLFFCIYKSVYSLCVLKIHLSFLIVIFERLKAGNFLQYQFLHKLFVDSQLGGTCLFLVLNLP